MNIDISTGKEKIIAFLDVLGFSEMINRNENSKANEYFNTVIDILTDIDKDEKISNHLISDSIILFTEINLENFRTLLTYVKSIQTELFLKDIFIRGSISKGEIFLDKENNIIAGKGLTRAYELEKEAIYPRVIIDPVLIVNFGGTKNDFISMFNEKNKSPSFIELNRNNSPAYWLFDETIIFDPDRMDSKMNDCFFISYGHELITKGFQFDEKNEFLIDKIYTIIQDRLYSSQKYYKKNFWIKKYLCEVIDEYYIIKSHLYIEAFDLDFYRNWKDKFNSL